MHRFYFFFIWSNSLKSIGSAQFNLAWVYDTVLAVKMYDNENQIHLIQSDNKVIAAKLQTEE